MRLRRRISHSQGLLNALTVLSKEQIRLAIYRDRESFSDNNPRCTLNGERFKRVSDGWDLSLKIQDIYSVVNTSSSGCGVKERILSLSLVKLYQNFSILNFITAVPRRADDDDDDCSFVLVSKAIALINGEQGIGGEVMFLDDFFSSMNIFGLRDTFTGQDPEHFSVGGLIEFHAVVDDSIVFVISTQNKVVGLVGLPWLKVMANLAGAA
uniref:Uncharacterized protein n=1 Tax=Glossina austeni TaxID=7395 RepID=A0A1A9UMR5_GLOAU